MKTKTMPAAVEVTDEAGVFEAIVSVFGNKDLAGDVVMPGAFTKSLDAWGERGDPIPIYWSHRLDDPTYNIGQVDTAREMLPGDPDMPEWVGEHVKTNGGLYVKGRLDDFGLGKQVAHLLKTRRVKQFSFSYDVLTERKSKDNSANELHELWLHEVGPTPLGCNPLTELISAKNQPEPPNPEPPEVPEPDAKTSPAPAGFFVARARIATARWRATYSD